MKRRRYVGCLAGGVICLAMLLALPPAAQAEGTSCGFETIMIPDGRVVASFIGASTSFYYIISTVVGRSYVVEFSNDNDADFGYPGALTVWSDFCATVLPTTNLTSVDPVATFTTRRAAFTATTTQTRFRLQNTSATAGFSYTFSAAETTMFSPSWSTNGTYETYYSVYNTTNTTRSVTLTLTKADGSPAGTTTFAVASGRTGATNTVALGTPANSSGTARLTHDGPPGAILVEADIANFSLSPPYIQPVKFLAPREKR